MDEGLRRRYLAAMGIPLWLPRGAAEEVAAVAEAPLPAHNEAREAISRPPRPSSPRPVSALPPAPAPLAEPVFPAAPNPAATELGLPGWDELQARVAACRACADLVRNRSRTVFGVGNREAQLVIIGEAPGVDEDRQGEPFVGRAGQLLNRMLQAIGFPREQVFIANILKCRPPGNRDPHQDEAQRCELFLLRQMELVAPKVILSVGRISAHSLLKTDAAVGRLRGRLHYFGERRIPLVVTYHPAYLLRSPEQKAKAWEDLQLAHRALHEEKGVG